jgi:hypothetical protein
MGLLSLGVIGAPILGVAFDKSIYGSLKDRAPELVANASTNNDFLGMPHDAVDRAILITPDKDENENGILDREEHTNTLDDKARVRTDAAWAWIDGISEEERTRVTTAYEEEDAKAGRAVLRYAVRFPALLVVAFGLIFLYFRSKGGYKPIILNEE